MTRQSAGAPELSGGEAERLILLRFRPMWEHIHGIREFSGVFTKTTFSDSELGDRVALVVHELLENAIKYSVSDESAELEVSIRHASGTLEIEVANKPEPAGVPVLRDAFARLNAVPPAQAYLEAMQRAVTLPEGQSGLGLARICHEGCVNLSMHEEGNLVRVRARGRI